MVENNGERPPREISNGTFMTYEINAYILADSISKFKCIQQYDWAYFPNPQW